MNRRYVADVGPLRFVWRTVRRQAAKRLSGRPQRFRLPTGLVMDLPADSAFASEIYVTGGNVDWGAEALFARHLDPARDVIDAGANIGYYALYAAPCARHVWAFEPDPRVLPTLRDNAARAPNVTVVAQALYCRPGEMTLAVGGRPEVNRLADDKRSDDGAAVIDVTVTTIDAFAAADPSRRFGGIKIDVEGVDLAVLDGARAVIARDRPLILTEFNADPAGVNDADRLADLADRAEYRLYAYLRTGRPAPRFGLRRLGRGDLADGGFKMIFLVPPALAEAFERTGS